MLRVFYEGLGEMHEGAECFLTQEEARHLIKVRRLRIGEAVYLLDGVGSVAVAHLIAQEGKTARLRVDAVTRHPPPAVQVRLFQAMPRKVVWENILQKACELGVSEIIPVRSDHMEAAPKEDRMERREQRWQQILVESIKQSGNPWVPVLRPMVPVAAGLEQSRQSAAAFCAALQPDSFRWAEVASGIKATASGFLDLWVGPEGDFSAREYEVLREAGVQFFTLGDTVLRVETAVVCSLALLNESIRKRRDN